MKIIEITSKEQLKEQLEKNAKNYLLFYKRNSQTSHCAYKSIEEVQTTQEIKIFGVDVSQTKDIHTQYNVSTVPTLLEMEYIKVVNIIKGCNPPNYYKNIFEDKIFVPQLANKENKPQKRVIVYSTPSCSWCNKLKQYLKENNIQYTDIDVSKDSRSAEEMVKKSGQQGVPQTDINGQIIVGFDKKQIDQLLEIKNN